MNLSKDDALILLETDAIPLKCNWVSEINFELTKIQPSFWMLVPSKGKSFLCKSITLMEMQFMLVRLALSVFE